MDNATMATLRLPLQVEFEKGEHFKESLLRLLKEDPEVKEILREMIHSSNATEKKTSSNTVSIQSSRDMGVGLSASRVPGENLYQEYSNLPESIRQQFCNVFRSDGFPAFVCCAAQPEAAQNIWDGIRRCMDGAAMADDVKRILSDVLAYAVAMSNNARMLGDKLEILMPEIGDEFSDRLHLICNAGGLKQGNIETVRLEGLKFSNELKAERPALVELR